MSRFMLSVRTWEEVESGMYAIVGSPQTVAEKLALGIEKLGVGHLLGLFQLGTLPHEATKANLELFSAEVMPALRREFPGGPTWPEG